MTYTEYFGRQATHIVLFILVTYSSSSKYLLVKIENPLNEHPNRHLVNNKGCGVDRMDLMRGRIIGGEYADEGEFPWLAVVLRRFRGMTSICGGSLISESWVLSAAHCLVDFKGTAVTQATVLLGHYNEHHAENAIERDSSNIIVHKQYRHTLSYEDDIGLIKLQGPAISLRGKVKVNTICLPLDYSNDEINEARHATVIGHGATAVKELVIPKEEIFCSGVEVWWEAVNVSARMKKLRTQLVNNDHCATIFEEIGERYCHKQSRVSPTKQLCAGVKVGQENACKGDSGGPLMIMDRKTTGQRRRWIQVGIVSFGFPNCVAEGVPGVYANVRYYLEWILDNLD